jgi:3'-phosphoadenosine 5'-phosphosulfate sulfotransferase (PAPS reductase)/FAD synthetase
MPPNLPNPVQRLCTFDLKIRRSKDYARSVGWDHWSQVIGLRADEPRRVARAKAAGEKEKWWDVDCPLAKAGVTEEDVMLFWARQPFDLRLAQHEGNCDLCFLKRAGRITKIMEERPDLAAWWIEKEAETGQRFRNDRPSYSGLLKMVTEQRRFDFGADDLTDCHCTD